MPNNETEERDHAYSIQLPIEQAIKVRDELEETVWAIAKEERVDQTLKEADFDVRVGKTFVDAHTLITVIVHWVVPAAASKVTSLLVEAAWKKVLARLREKYGSTVLVDKNKPEEE